MIKNLFDVLVLMFVVVCDCYLKNFYVVTNIK
jgi:hypothetical protein